MAEPRFREASAADLAAIITLLRDDALGAARESTPDDPRYASTFAAIERDPNNAIFVLEEGGRIIACAQLTIIPGLSRQAMTRGQIESVRTAAEQRGKGLGRKLFGHLIAEAKRRGCGLVQLTSDRTRSDAHRFYEQLGFVASHEGYKLAL